MLYCSLAAKGGREAGDREKDHKLKGGGGQEVGGGLSSFLRLKQDEPPPASKEGRGRGGKEEGFEPQKSGLPSMFFLRTLLPLVYKLT